VTSELARTAHVEHYAESIADKFLRRPTLASANALAAATEDPSVSTDECLQQIQESLLELEAASGRTTARHVREFMPEVLRELETQAANQGLVGMSTGIPSLDRVTGGDPERGVVDNRRATREGQDGVGCPGCPGKRDCPAYRHSLSAWRCRTSRSASGSWRRNRPYRQYRFVTRERSARIAGLALRKPPQR